MKPFLSHRLFITVIILLVFSSVASGASKNPLAGLNMTDLTSMVGDQVGVATGGAVSGKCTENASCDEPGAIPLKDGCVREVMCPLVRKLIVDMCFFIAGLITALILPILLYLIGRDIKRKDYKHPIRWTVTVVLIIIALLLFVYPIETLQFLGII
jgi:hypothetical protein